MNAPKGSASLKMFEAESGIRLVSHATKAVTTAAKASAMMRPTAISMRLPLRTKFLKPVMSCSSGSRARGPAKAMRRLHASGRR